MRSRLRPAAIIPTVTPQEAIEEAEYAVKTLGFKVGMLHGVIQRPIPSHERPRHPPDASPLRIVGASPLRKASPNPSLPLYLGSIEG